jgi:hypothetical protein
MAAKGTLMISVPFLLPVLSKAKKTTQINLRGYQVFKLNA